LLDEEDTETAEPVVQAMKEDAEQDYKAMYIELKKKHDELLKIVRAFMESVTKNST
jgi:flagellar biosynthesis protein FliP